MKLTAACLPAFLALSILFAAPASADPPYWVELRADGISFTFPGQGLIEIAAAYSILNNMDHDEVIVTDIAFELDGERIAVQPIDVTRSLNQCRFFSTPAECAGECYISQTPPIQLGVCAWYYPYPMDSIPEGCFCTFSTELKITLPYAGEQTAAFCLDPNNALWEPSEGNNRRSMFIGPIVTDTNSWGSVKALYGGE